MSPPDAMLLVIAAAAVLIMVGLGFTSRRRARRLRAEFQQAFPPEWIALLENALPLYRKIPTDLRKTLEPLTREFLAEVEFVGCQGLVVTQEMRLVIATQACLLVVRLGMGAYAHLHSVLIYPDEFVVHERDEDEAGVVTEGSRALSGQTFETARVILSWRDVQDSGAEGEAYNVTLHEFAHYLDHALDGAASAPDASASAWQRILDEEYDRLCAAVEHDEPTLIDPYGAEHPAEFFAVATETFFEQPIAMERLHGALYGELKRFYGLDPARWT